MTLIYSGLIGFGLIAQALSFVPYVLLMLPITYALNIKLYVFNRKEDCQKLQHSLTRWTTTLKDGSGCGYSLGLDYCAFIDVNPKEIFNGYNAWLICSEKKFAHLMSEKEEHYKKEEEDNSYCILHKSSGSYNNTYYIKNSGELLFTPRKNQQCIINKILQLFNEQGRVVAFISGQPNSGKSMVGVFLAHKLGGMYCNEFTPWMPGDSLSLIKHEHKPSKSCPLIISMDEIDDAIVKISKGLVRQSETTMINTSSKNGWNTLFDNVERGMYPNTIILLTSNKTPSEIASQCGGDVSYLRDKRVTEFFKL